MLAFGLFHEGVPDPVGLAGNCRSLPFCACRSMTAAAMLSLPNTDPRREISKFVVMIRLRYSCPSRDHLKRQPGLFDIVR